MHRIFKEARMFDSPYRARELTKMVYGGESVTINKFLSSLQKVDDQQQYNIYWGELHAHSRLSDGRNDPDNVYNTIKNKAGLDFGALSDHDHGGVGKKELWDSGWNKVIELAEKYNNPGSFVTLLAYERDSYPWFNNIVVYYRDGAGDMIRGETDGEINKSELEALLSREDVLIVPHTTSTLKSGADLLTVPPELMPRLIEVYSRWGTSEYFGNPNPVRSEVRGGHWRDALERGIRMGCIAGSDDHGMNAGMFDKSMFQGNLRYQNPGLTAVLAKELTRESIFDALKARKCYASMGARILINFNINGHVMGSEINLNRGEDCKISIKITGEDRLQTVTLVKNGIDYWIEHINGESKIFEDVLYCHQNTRKTDYYYVRVEQADGRKAWTSPIWVTEAGEM